MCFHTHAIAAAILPKPHYRLRFHLFDGKTPLWWVEKTLGPMTVWGFQRTRSTGGYVDPATAVAEAVRL